MVAERSINCDPDHKVYPAAGGMFSIRDILASAADGDHISGGISRISDFHFKVGYPVRFRYDSGLEELEGGAPLTEQMVYDLLYPLFGEDHRRRFEASSLRDIDFGYSFPDNSVGFRVNAFRDQDGPAFVVRILPGVIPDAEGLRFPSAELFETLVNLKHGLVIVTGVTGSGKSTTIASIINAINQRRRVRIITLEDPIEYRYQSAEALISQRELGTHIDSFKSGLTSALRENPDIIVVGEMRDLETTALALSAAETGHLVFSTLHTPSTVGSITRILDMFPPDRVKELAVQLSLSLEYVLSQKLIPRIDGNGRVLAMEVMRNIPSVANQIRTGKLQQMVSVMETNSKLGMVSMSQSLATLYHDGLISREDAILHAYDESIMNLLGR